MFLCHNLTNYNSWLWNDLALRYKINTARMPVTVISLQVLSADIFLIFPCIKAQPRTILNNVTCNKGQNL
jgi:hypothetical protein